jgi:4-hydroxy-3-methylbut-2-enyl diphosphate reductase
MGQYKNENGGIYLVESPEDVEKLEVKDPKNLHYMSQTTLSVDDTADVIEALRQKFPDINGPRKDDICYATQNRQDAVRELASDADIMLVVGARNSSNSNRLRELSEKMGTPAYLIDDASCIDKSWLEGKEKVAVTAGASAPEVLVQEVIAKLQSWGGKTAVELSGREENITFSIPPELRPHPAA